MTTSREEALHYDHEQRGSVKDRVGPNKDDVLGRCMFPFQYVDRRLDHKAINTRRFNLEKHVMVVEGAKKNEVKFKKIEYDSSQPHYWMFGNFAPVDETPLCKDLKVIDHLWECLNGEFVRVGPNPKFALVAGYHWFEEDGCDWIKRLPMMHLLIYVVVRIFIRTMPYADVIVKRLRTDHELDIVTIIFTRPFVHILMNLHLAIVYTGSNLRSSPLSKSLPRESERHVDPRHGYAVSSLLDMAYRLTKQNLQISSFKLQNVCLLA
ncbi:carotenoid cleavage dioxygenase 1 [Tanacetum coccineum]